MGTENEVQVLDGKQDYSIRLQRGDNSIDFSPELSQQMCSEIINLGTQLISEAGRVTAEYFNSQVNMYYGQLSAYVEKQRLKSDERKIILSQLESITDKYLEVINETEDTDKREQYMSEYERMANVQSKIYLDALRVDSDSNEVPKIPNLLGGLRKLFHKK
jgi:hypothetical protein